MEELIPIDTSYKGYWFRSRLEARWAVFFDNMGWDWVYEHEGFKLPSGYYLPDFYFPELNLWAEVKPTELNELDFTRCKELSERMKKSEHGVDVLLMEGSSIDCKAFRTIINGNLSVKVLLVHISEQHYPFFVSDTYHPNRHYFMDETIKSIEKARSSRFEFEWKEQ